MAESNRDKILQNIKQRSRDGLLSLADALAIAGQWNCSLRDVEHIALDHAITPSRFQRNSLSCQEQLRLFLSRVAIIGCGGLGGRTAELLARLGIGHLILTDPDVFSESNLNRQIFCSTESLGCNKVDIVDRELQKINPALETTLHISTFTTGSIDTADIVIDALDSTEARITLSKLCRKQQIPMVHGAVKEWYGQAGIDQASNNLISTLYPQKTAPSSPPRVLPMSVALIASIQAAEATKSLLGHNSSLTGSWLETDLLHCEFDSIKIPHDI